MDILGLLRRQAGDYRCPMCHRSLADCKLRQLDHQGPHYTVEVTCTNCELAFVVALEVTRSAGEAEADQEELEDEWEPLPAISPDELLEVHLALQGLQGPLSELLQESSPHD